MPTLKANHIFVTDKEDAKITKSALSDFDNLPLTEEELKLFKPAHEVFNAKEYVERTNLIKKPERPKSKEIKDLINIRLDKSITTHLRASGKGWQTRLNDFLAKAVAHGQL